MLKINHFIQQKLLTAVKTIAPLRPEPKDGGRGKMMVCSKEQPAMRHLCWKDKA